MYVQGLVIESKFVITDPWKQSQYIGSFLNLRNDTFYKFLFRIGVYATRNQWRNNSRKNEGMEPKQKEYPAVDIPGDRSKVQCCKQQYCIGTWNVRSMNQGKLEVVK